MSVAAGYMVPHPPLIIPEVGRGDQIQIEDTVFAYHKVGREIAGLKPDTVVVISPHNVLYGDYFHIRPEARLSGDFGQFQAGKVRVEVSCDTGFVRELCRVGEKEEMPWGTLGSKGDQLDHGTMIPLYFLNHYYRDYKLVSIGLSGFPLTMHYRLGQAIKRTADFLKRRTVVIASGDLSHYLKEEGPYGYREEGLKYDRQIMEIMGRADFERLLEVPGDFLDRAGECGHRSFVIMAGALDRLSVKAEQLSYQGTFGVGYGICSYHVTGEDGGRNFLDQYQAGMKRRRQERQAGEDPYISLARQSLECFVNTGRMLTLPKGLPKEMLTGRAGAFVSIHEGGRLRGCIGTISPVCENIAGEIIENAVSAGTRDPRFPQIMPDELDSLEYSVDILGEPERIDSTDELDVKTYGVIVTKGRKRGLLLPDLDGVDTPEQQVAIAKEKAGILPGDRDVSLERFRVIRHGEKS